MKILGEKVRKCFVVLVLNLLVIPASFNGQEVSDRGALANVVIPGPVGGLEAIQERVVYPEFAEKFWIEGNVFLEAYVDTDGTVINTEIVEGVEQLNQAAINALEETKFNPAYIDGRPIKSRVLIRVTFKMEN